ARAPRRLDQHSGDDGPLYQFHSRVLDARVERLADVRIGPAVKAAVFDRGRVFGHEVVAQQVAFIHRRPQLAVRRVPGKSDRIANPLREDAVSRPVGIVFIDSGANGRLALVDIRPRPDRDVHLLAVTAEEHVARPMPANRQFDELLRRPFELRLADLIFEADDAVALPTLTLGLTSFLM